VASVSTANEEAIEAWNGVLFDRFRQFRHLLVGGLTPHSDRALAYFPPRPDDRVLDIGCGFGDTAQQLAGLVGPTGEVVGVDSSERFIETARQEAEEAGVENVGFDYVFARMGTMFFGNPVPAHRNIRRAMKPGGRLCNVVWRRKIDNEWLYRAEQVVERFVTEDEDSDELTCGPGPFALADADKTTQVLLSAGFADISLRRSDLPFVSGRDIGEAVELVMGIGPAGEVLRLAGDQAVELRPQIESALREELGHLEGPDGVVTTASTWIVTATAA
jgi:ubiquinone/menaquinone biosynthesis C-methylase UbiE